jgi:hypothetical protein
VPVTPTTAPAADEAEPEGDDEGDGEPIVTTTTTAVDDPSAAPPEPVVTTTTPPPPVTTPTEPASSIERFELSGMFTAEGADVGVLAGGRFYGSFVIAGEGGSIQLSLSSIAS